MNEQHKNEPSKIEVKPADANEHQANKMLDGARNPGEPPVGSEPLLPANKSSASPDAKPTYSKT